MAVLFLGGISYSGLFIFVFVCKLKIMAKKSNSGGFVYSTNPDFEPEDEETGNSTNLPPTKQTLIVSKSVKGRGGKVATLVSGFIGSDNDLEALGKLLKNKCGTGGSVKDREILIQGDIVRKIGEILQKEGYKVKLSGI